MGLETIRVDIVTAMSAAATLFTTYPLTVEYDNREVVDTKTQENPFLTVEIKMMDGEQANLANQPTHRMYGQIHICAVVPKGAGRAAANVLLDHFYAKIQRKTLGSVKTEMAVPADKKEHLGWIYYPVLVPFWSDQPT